MVVVIHLKEELEVVKMQKRILIVMAVVAVLCLVPMALVGQTVITVWPTRAMGTRQSTATTAMTMRIRFCIFTTSNS